MCLFKRKSYKDINVKNYSYLGPQYNNNEINQILDSYENKKKYKIKYLDDNELSKYIAKSYLIQK